MVIQHLVRLDLIPFIYMHNIQGAGCQPAHQFIPAHEATFNVDSLRLDSQILQIRLHQPPRSDYCKEFLCRFGGSRRRRLIP